METRSRRTRMPPHENVMTTTSSWLRAELIDRPMRKRHRTLPRRVYDDIRSDVGISYHNQNRAACDEAAASLACLPPELCGIIASYMGPFGLGDAVRRLAGPTEDVSTTRYYMNVVDRDQHSLYAIRAHHEWDFVRAIRVVLSVNGEPRVVVDVKEDGKTRGTVLNGAKYEMLDLTQWALWDGRQATAAARASAATVIADATIMTRAAFIAKYVDPNQY